MAIANLISAYVCIYVYAWCVRIFTRQIDDEMRERCMWRNSFYRPGIRAYLRARRSKCVLINHRYRKKVLPKFLRERSEEAISSAGRASVKSPDK